MLKQGKRQLQLLITNNSSQAKQVVIKDNCYGQKDILKSIAANSKITLLLNLEKSQGWYDFTLSVRGEPSFERKYAGKVENGKSSISDPAMATL